MHRGLILLFLFLFWIPTAFAAGTSTGRISGAWIPPAVGPVSDGIIYFFNTEAGPPPERGRSRRVPDARALTKADGTFSVELPEGSYYLAAWKKVAGEVPGPPQDGDLHALSRDTSGAPVVYTVKSGGTTDIGIFRQGTVYKSPVVKLSAGMTAITGTLTDQNGSPLAGAVVQLYVNPGMRSKPAYVSQKTGKDGIYIVQVDDGGTYFLSVRSGYGGGRLQAGDLYGLYGGETAQPITVKRHEVTKGIDVRVGHFADNRPE